MECEIEIEEKAKALLEKYGHKTYLNLEDATYCSNQSDKPLLIMFTGWACLADGDAPWEILMEEDVKRIIEKNFTLVALYVDDRRPLSKQDTIELDGFGTRILKTIGDKNSVFQMEHFKSNTQPQYVIVQENLQPTSEFNSYASLKEKQKFKDFLLSGIRK